MDEPARCFARGKQSKPSPVDFESRMRLLFRRYLRLYREAWWTDDRYAGYDDAICFTSNLMLVARKA